MKCTACGVDKPLDDFHQNQYWCKDCKCAIEKNRRKEKSLARYQEIESLPGEEWRKVRGCEELYEISNKGRVKSLFRQGGGGLLKPHLGNNGYHTVLLRNKETNKKHCVHRLIAEAFIENPDNLPCVDHIDRVRTNNILENLRWASLELNAKNRTREVNIHTGVEKNTDKDGTVRHYNFIRASWTDSQRHTKRFKTMEEANEFKRVKDVELAALRF